MKKRTVWISNFLIIVMVLLTITSAAFAAEEDTSTEEINPDGPTWAFLLIGLVAITIVGIFYAAGSGSDDESPPLESDK